MCTLPVIFRIQVHTCSFVEDILCVGYILTTCSKNSQFFDVYTPSYTNLSTLALSQAACRCGKSSRISIYLNTCALHKVVPIDLSVIVDSADTIIVLVWIEALTLAKKCPLLFFPLVLIKIVEAAFFCCCCLFGFFCVCVFVFTWDDPVSKEIQIPKST